MGSYAPAKCFFDVQREEAMRLERGIDVEVRYMARPVAVIGYTPAEGGEGFWEYGDDSCPPGTLRAARLNAADFPTPLARPITMPTQQFEYWTPSLMLAALVGLVRRWRPAPLAEPDAPQGRQSRA